MRYKTQVADKLDSIQMKLNYLVRGLEEKRYTPQEILRIVKETGMVTEQAIELVDKELKQTEFIKNSSK